MMRRTGTPAEEFARSQKLEILRTLRSGIMRNRRTYVIRLERALTRLAADYCKWVTAFRPPSLDWQYIEEGSVAEAAWTARAIVSDLMHVNRPTGTVISSLAASLSRVEHQLNFDMVGNVAALVAQPRRMGERSCLIQEKYKQHLAQVRLLVPRLPIKSQLRVHELIEDLAEQFLG